MRRILPSPMLVALLIATNLCASLIAQQKTNFSGTWTLDAERSGPEPEVWLQHRSLRFVIRQTAEDVTLDTGDGSLFGWPSPVTDSPLRYRLDGSPVTVLDRTLGDLPDFIRKIQTAASWLDNARLLTRTTHLVERPGGQINGNTRVLIFSLTNDRVMKVERTGYRGPDPGPSTYFGALPKTLHKGRIEDDRAYAKDVAFYRRVSD